MSEWLSKGVREIILYKSVSQNIWANLAFEDWILQNADLTFRRILFLWRNQPCVVIGRHQNPWLEANVSLLRERGVDLARRRSGGGAVYHDLGNVNCTAFAHRQDYNRPRNLWLMCHALNERWGVELSVNKRDDIVCQERWKVSGSSSKLTRDSTYHHFTLLLHTDTPTLHQALTPHRNSELQFSRSIATPSQRSEVINLCQLVPHLTFDTICTAVAEKFYDVHRVIKNRKIVEIDPMAEGDFPGITEMKKELQDWKWIYGKTPKFSVMAEQSFSFGHLVFTAEVVQGIISSCDLGSTAYLYLPDTTTCSSLSDLGNALVGCRFWNGDIAMVLRPYWTNSRESAEVCQWILHLA